MMRPDNALPAVYLCKRPVDFRKGIQGLAVVVESELIRDPFSERLFVFQEEAEKSITLQVEEVSISHRRAQRRRKSDKTSRHDRE